MLCGFGGAVELAEAAPVVTPGCVLEGVTSRTPGVTAGFEALFCAVFGFGPVDWGVVAPVTVGWGVVALVTAGRWVVAAVTVGPAEVLRP
ncbi:hypothetical protein [Nitrobacter sp.]|uniref:hypothetical protein n=1 Tax=Nitrobacter sp. TaxID=29420 RepID=UPI00399D6DBB